MSKPSTGRRRRKGKLALWRVEGEESGESSGGAVCLFVATAGRTAVPDVAAAIDSLSKGRYAFCNVTRVEQVGDLSSGQTWPALPPPDDDDDEHAAFSYIYGCHDQTGYNLDAVTLVGLTTYFLRESDRKKPKPKAETPYTARLHRVAPTLLAIARTFAVQLYDAMRMVPCTAPKRGPCVHCAMKDDHDRIMRVIADLLDGGPR